MPELTLAKCFALLPMKMIAARARMVLLPLWTYYRRISTEFSPNSGPNRIVFWEVPSYAHHCTVVCVTRVPP